ncbi:hypothetical protein QTP86_011728 [Hemibagrus guttatus]|nr:hypothetical protein QTP86_011728 [Hemibagrus guttatus]
MTSAQLGQKKTLKGGREGNILPPEPETRLHPHRSRKRSSTENRKWSDVPHRNRSGASTGKTNHVGNILRRRESKHIYRKQQSSQKPTIKQLKIKGEQGRQNHQQNTVQ